MRKLILQMQMTVDGFVADPNGSTTWQVWNWNDNWNWDNKLKRYFNEVFDSVDCILLSRKMAKEGFIQHWKNAAINPRDARHNYASKINRTHKVVFSKTMENSEWENVDLAKGDLAEEVNRLKSQQGKNIIVYGGVEFVKSLIQAGLVDEYQFFINPAAIGNGISIFTDLVSKKDFVLLGAQAYECGISVLRYK